MCAFNEITPLQNKISPDVIQDGLIDTKLVLHQGTWFSSSQLKNHSANPYYGDAAPTARAWPGCFHRPPRHDFAQGRTRRQQKLARVPWLSISASWSPCASITAQGTGNSLLRLYFVLVLKRSKVLIIWDLIPLAGIAGVLPRMCFHLCPACPADT